MDRPFGVFTPVRGAEERVGHEPLQGVEPDDEPATVGPQHRQREDPPLVLARARGFPVRSELRQAHLVERGSRGVSLAGGGAGSLGGRGEEDGPVVEASREGEERNWAPLGGTGEGRERRPRPEGRRQHCART